MPCGSEAWKFVWWAAGDNGGRSTWDFLRIAGCPDLKAYDSVIYNENVGASWNDYYWSNMRSHTQGIPPELKGCPVISNTRNPYAKTISNFADRNMEHYTATGEDYNLKDWVFETYSIGRENNISGSRRLDQKEFADVDRFPWVEWGTVPHQYNWKQHQPKEHAVIPLPFPTYHLRVEHLKEDIMKIPEIIINAKPEDFSEAVEHTFRQDSYQENYRRIVEYNDDGTLNWEVHMDQELADFIYEGTKMGFELCGYDKDSWKK